MSNVLKKLNKFFKLILFTIPTPLPIGMAEFDSWSADIISTYNLPNNDSIRFAIATMILHSPEKKAFISKFSFFLKVRKGMANQIAGGIMQELKEKQAAAAKAQQEAVAANEIAKA